MRKILSIIEAKMGLMRMVDANNISRDPEVVRDYLNEPLVFRGNTPVRLGVELLKAMLCVTTGADKITLPFMVVRGEDDKIIDPGGAQMLYDKASSKDKGIRIYEKLYHEVFNELERAIVLKHVGTWLAAHV